MIHEFEPYGDLIHPPGSRIYIDRDQLIILGENLIIPKSSIRTHQGIIHHVLDLTNGGRVESRVVHDFIRECLFIKRIES